MSVSPSPDSASASPMTNSIACRPRPHISRLRQCSASGPHAHGSLCRTQTGLMFFPPRVLFFRFFFPAAVPSYMCAKRCHTLSAWFPSFLVANFSLSSVFLLEPHTHTMQRQFSLVFAHEKNWLKNIARALQDRLKHKLSSVCSFLLKACSSLIDAT